MNYQSADVNLLPIAEEYFKNMFTEIPGTITTIKA